MYGFKTVLVQKGHSVQTFTCLCLCFDLASYGSLESNHEQVKGKNWVLSVNYITRQQAIFTRQITTVTRHWRPGEWLRGALKSSCLPSISLTDGHCKLLTISVTLEVLW